MTKPTRLAGWGSAADGSIVTWTVSEGGRGRRWREVVGRGDLVVHALLYETDTGGRFSHLELARADGLWTFHPEGDGTLHGNHVDRSEAGVRHIEGWPFGVDDVLVIEGSPVGLAAVVHRWSASLSVGGSVVVGGVVVGRDGGLRRDEAVAIERVSAGSWRVSDGPLIEVTETGVPALPDGRQHALEVG
jgi:hypothetical protein